MVWRDVGDPDLEASPARSRRGPDRRNNAGAAGNSARVVGRRRALPSGRVLLGGFLVAAAALVVFAAVLSGAGGGSKGHFVVASRSLQAGSLLEPSDLSVESLRLPSAVAQSAFTDAGRLVGRQLAVPVTGGELLEATMLTGGTGPHLRPVTVPIDPASLGSLIPGQPVDVLETSGPTGSPTVTVVLRGATLLEVSKGTSGFLSSAGSAVVTIGVTNLGEVEAVLEASRAGTITLVVAEPSDGVGPGSGTPSVSPADGGPSTTGGASG